MRIAAYFLSAALLAATDFAQAQSGCDGYPVPCVRDVAIAYPATAHMAADMRGSTHELTFNRKDGKSLWITAPMYDAIVEVAMNGAMKFHPMPAGSMPHGISFDGAGRLYASLEGAGAVAEIDPASGAIKRQIAVNADPHGLGIGPDGKTVWFTGKSKNTVGRILGDGMVLNFPLRTVDALPIYIAAGRDGHMWFTELTGNKIGRVTAGGDITEFKIPTDDSRPIAIVQDPSAYAMWFSEEAGNKVGRIDAQGNITEFDVPKSQSNSILAGLAFDADGNLWVQQYVNQNKPEPEGPDFIIKIGKSILKAQPGDKLDFTFYEVPTRKTVMHRIVQGPDMNMWFTELKADRFGRVILKEGRSAKSASSSP